MSIPVRSGVRRGPFGRKAHAGAPPAPVASIAMHKIRLAVLLSTIVAAFAFVVGGPVRPDSAAAHTDCDDFWRHSGHTDNARWHHCHDWITYGDGMGGSITRARVHICGYSGTLHGITVGHHHISGWWDSWDTSAHAHDVGGEGC